MILTLIIIFIIVEYLLQLYLGIINERYSRNPIPNELCSIYNNWEYRRHSLYLQAKRRFGRWSSAVDTVIFIALLASGFLGWALSVCGLLCESALLRDLVFLAAGTIAAQIYTLPFEYIGTFRIEERFGFNKCTLTTFIIDAIKSTLISLLFTCALYGAIFQYYEMAGSNFWIAAWIFISAIYILLNATYANTIIPLFNKLTPLQPGDLRTAIESFASRNNFALKGIYVIDGSKRSTKANAFFCGFGRTKKIILYDTLINQLTIDETVAVLAHEIGHYKHHDIIKNMASSVFTMGVYLFTLSLFVGNPELSSALGFNEPSLLLSLIAFSLLITPINIILGPITNSLSRRAEYRADTFAANAGLGKHLVSALKKLTANSLSPLLVHPIYVTFSLSHPTLIQRIDNINNTNNSI